MFKRKKAKGSGWNKSDNNRNQTKSADGSLEIVTLERPRICLVDIDRELSNSLISKGYNCYIGTLGPLVEIPNTQKDSIHKCLLNHEIPLNLHEYDIVIVDLQEPETISYRLSEHTHKVCKGHEQMYLASSYPETLFDPRALSGTVLRDRIRPLLEKESIIILFAAPQETIEYQTVSISKRGVHHEQPSSHSLYSFYSDFPNSENVSGKDTKVVVSEDTLIGSILAKYNDFCAYNIAFEHPTYWKNSALVKSGNFLPLMTAETGKIVSYAHLRDKNWIFCFPNIRNKDAFLSELLERVLPGITPVLFPYSTQFAWLDTEQYLLPNEEELLAQRARLVAGHEKKLKDIDIDIDANRQQYEYLHNIITKTGAELVQAVERFFNWLEFKDVTNIDETNPKMKEEDLQFKIPEGLMVVEIKGIGGTSTDSECSQISKIKFRRSRERESFDVFGLYCVNHQRYLPPHRRRNPPFNQTQIQDAINDERGLVWTYELYKQYFNIIKGLLLKEDARKSICQVGLVEFSPSDAVEITTPIEIHHNGYVVVFSIQDVEVRSGTEVILDKDGWFRSAIIEEVQVDGSAVDSVSNGEVGARLSIPFEKGVRLWINVLGEKEP